MIIYYIIITIMYNMRSVCTLIHDRAVCVSSAILQGMMTVEYGSF